MTPPAPPGRPRSESSRNAILAAAIAMVGEDGYAGLTIEKLASRAGVGKQTIYRWWASKADVLLEASIAKTDYAVPVADTGSYRGDLSAFLEASYAVARLEPYADVLRAMAAEAQIDPEFGERFRSVFITARRAAFAEITDRAARRGDLPAGLSADLATDIVFAVIWYRVLATHQPLDDQLRDELVALLAPAGSTLADDGALVLPESRAAE